MTNPVFVNKDCFRSEFVPDRIIGREKQIEEIKRKIRLELLPVIHIYGPSGSGKTAVIMHIFKNISNSVYVNCWERGTYRQIFDEILRRSNIVVHEKESRFSLLQKLRRIPKKIICLDNVEHLADARVIPDLAQYSNSLVLVSNKHFLKHSNGKILDKIARDEIQFEKYDNRVLMEILKQRASDGLNPESLDTKMLSEIVKLCDGNAACAIQTLGLAVAKMDESGNKKISKDDIQYGLRCVVTNHFSFLVSRLNAHQKILYEILQRQRCIPSGNLYNEYRKNMDETVTDRCYRKYMKGLVKNELAREIGSGRWKKYEIVS